VFSDRGEAGDRLATLLNRLDIDADSLVAIPRGGNTVGRTVAARLALPLDVIVTQNLYAPGETDVPIGAVTDAGTVWLDEPLVPEFGIVDEYVSRESLRAIAFARAEAERYRDGSSRPDPAGGTVLVVTDAIDQRAPVIAVVRQLRDAAAERIVVAAPVVDPRLADRLAEEADELVCLEQPLRFDGVEAYYGRPAAHSPEAPDEPYLAEAADADTTRPEAVTPDSA
jgi:predicted phosphoribosyltransferase